MRSCTEQVQTVGHDELRHMMESGDPPLLVDVRQPEEYVLGHIPGSILIPLGQLEMGHPALDHERVIVVYCRSGRRSMTGARILCRMGFDNVLSLRDGIMGWPYELIEGPPVVPMRTEEVRSVLEILTTALEMELSARRFYEGALAAPASQSTRATLQYLVSMERSHTESLYSRYIAMAREAHEPRRTLEEIEGSLIAEDPAALGLAGDSNVKDVLENAIQREFEAYDYYKTSADAMRRDDLKEALFGLALEERSHAASLLELLGRQD